MNTAKQVTAGSTRLRTADCRTYDRLSRPLLATCALLALVACTRENPPDADSAPPPETAVAPRPAASPAPAAAAFRALGQEPGWLLEIRPERQIEFSYDYGEQQVSTPVPVPEISGRQTIYHAVTEANDLRVEIVEEACADVMSGQPYPATVRVTLNGDVYEGCGGPSQ